MAFAFANFLAAANGKGSQTTLSTSGSFQSMPVGSLIVVTVACDNTLTTDGTGADAVASVADSAGNTYQLAGSYRNGQGAAQAGSSSTIWYSVITNAIVSASTTWTVTITPTTGYARAFGVTGFTLGAGSSVSVAGSGGGAGDAGVDPVASITGLAASTEYLWIGSAADEGTTATGAASGFTKAGGANTTGGSGALNMSHGAYYVIDTQTSKTFTPATALDAAAALVAFRELLPATLDAWNVNDKQSNITLSNNDKTVTTTIAGGSVRSTRSNSTGKYYFEFVFTGPASPPGLGLKDAASSLTNTTVNCFIVMNRTLYINGVGSGGVVLTSELATNDVLCIAWDADAKRVWCRKNNDPWNDSFNGDPVAGTGGMNVSSVLGTDFAAYHTGNATGNVTTIRTEAAEYTQAIPSGFKSWMGETPDAWNANDKSASIALSNSDKTSTSSLGSTAAVRSSSGVLAGTAVKVYAEIKVTAITAGGGLGVGLGEATQPLTDVYGTDSIAVTSGGLLVVNGSLISSNMGTMVSGDVIGIAYDAGAELAWVRRNTGNWNANAAANPDTGASGANVSSMSGTVLLLGNHTTANIVLDIRTEAAEFTQTPPSGFLSWMGETITVDPNVNVTPTGVSAATAVGTVTVTAKQNVSFAATGVAATTALGTASAGVAVSTSATGQTAIAALGTATAAGKTNISTSATGQTAVAAVGTATATGKINVSVAATGVSAGTALGTATATGAGGNPLWTPADLGSDLIAWYDFNDAPTVIQSGGYLTEWRDKSGNARHGIPASLAVFVINPDGIYLPHASGALSVIQMPVLPSAYFDFAFAGKPHQPVGSSWRTLMAQYAGGQHHILVETGTANLGSYANSWVPAGSLTWPSVDGQVYFSGADAANVRVGRDGSALVEEVGENFVPDNAPCLMNYAVAGGQGFGTAREFVFMLASRSQDIRDRVSGYLAHKWDGILGVTTHVDALPAGHPYKAAPPTTDGSVFATPAGVSATAAVGTVTATGGAYIFELDGTNAEALLGTATATGKTNISTSATGQTATAALGTATATAKINISVAATGVSAGSALGTATATGATNISTSATGQTAVAVSGTATATAKQNVSIAASGVTAATALGGASASAGGSITAAPSGVSAAAALGTATAEGKISVSTSAAGVGAAALVGTATASGIVAGDDNGFAIPSALNYFVYAGIANDDVVTIETAPPDNPDGYENWYGEDAAAINVTVTPAGVAAATQLGTASAVGIINVTVPADGVIAATALGTATATAKQNVSVAATGVSATAAVGGVSVSVGGGISIQPAGVTATAAVGSVTVTAKQFVTATPAGVAAAAVAGTPSVSAGTSVTPTGVIAASALGAVTVTAKQSVIVAATGVSAPSALGGVTVSAGGSISVVGSGVEAVARAGTATATGKQSVIVAASGVAAGAALGSVTASGKINISTMPAGTVATTALGSVTVTAKVNVVALPAGVAALAQAGTATATGKRNVSTMPVGVAAPALVGSATAIGTTGGVGVWMGTAFEQKPVKVWTGAAWVAKPPKTWNGSAWV